MTNMITMRSVTIMVFVIFNLSFLFGQNLDSIISNTKFSIELHVKDSISCNWRIINREYLRQNDELFETLNLIDGEVKKNEVQGILQHRKFADSTWTYFILKSGLSKPLVIYYKSKMHNGDIDQKLSMEKVDSNGVPIRIFKN